MLVAQKIKNQVLSLIDDVDNAKITREEARVLFADKLTAIIMDAITDARITFAPGDIKVFGSQSAQSNTSPLILEGKLS